MRTAGWDKRKGHSRGNGSEYLASLNPAGYSFGYATVTRLLGFGIRPKQSLLLVKKKKKKTNRQITTKPARTPKINLQNR
jgi:hypothetical protein